jgi:hypothetical protein
VEIRKRLPLFACLVALTCLAYFIGPVVSDAAHAAPQPGSDTPLQPALG